MTFSGPWLARKQIKFIASGSNKDNKVIHACLKIGRKSCLIVSNTKKWRHFKKTQQSKGQISHNHRRFIIHFYSKQEVVDIFFCSLCFYITFRFKPLSTSICRSSSFPLLFFYVVFSTAQCVLSTYEMTESDLSVAGRSVLKMPLNCEM